MKEYYAKYKGKFEILGVDCNDTEAKWKAAVAKHQLPWLHVANGTGANDVTQIYGIQGFPTKILVDPKGKIAKVVGAKTLLSIRILTAYSVRNNFLTN